MSTERPVRILVVEDEAKIAAAMRDYLQAAGYRVTIIARGDLVMDALRADPPDVLLLDLMLPGMDGLAVCRQVRVISDVPILMVTARIDEIDRLLGLELGADDYICKPFSLRELLARVKAVLRRAHSTFATTQPVELDADRFEMRVQGVPIAVTPVEVRLLQRLLDPPGRVWSRPQLMREIYADHRVVSDRTVDSHIRNLRRKFAPFDRDPITSVYGVGFRFEWS